MTKIISISDEAYDRLKRIKGDRSFTKVVLDLTERKKRSPLDYAGILEGDEELLNIYDKILEERRTRPGRTNPTW